MDKSNIASNYEKNTNKKFFDLRANIIKKLFKSKKPRILADIGCGTGIFLDHFKNEFDYGIGIDNTKEMILFAQKNHKKKNITYAIGKGDIIPLADNSVDFVLSMGILENITDKRKHINESLRILKKDGILFLTTPIRSMTRLYDIAKIFGKAAPRYWPISYISYKELANLVPKEAKVLEHRIFLFNPSNIKIIDHFLKVVDKLTPKMLNRYMLGPQYIILKKG